jgi:F0F1-type ATP synthase membrane subunit b/b'
MDLLINIAITGMCLFLLGIYFNYREKRLTTIADRRIKELKEKYVAQISDRKAREKKEIEKLKDIVISLETEHKKILKEKATNPAKNTKLYEQEARKIIKHAEERARRIEQEVRDDARHFLEQQKKEVQTKMVDLVMGVAKKVLAKSLTYEEHKELIETTLMEVEGEAADDERA